MNPSPLHRIPGRTKRLPPLRVGVGGPVGSGKTTLVELLCKTMRERWDLVVVTNDIYTKEDQRLLTVAGALAPERIVGVETGGCPHTAIREDASINLEAVDRLLEQFPDADIVFIESGGANAAATASRGSSRCSPLRSQSSSERPVCNACWRSSAVSRVWHAQSFSAVMRPVSPAHQAACACATSARSQRARPRCNWSSSQSPACRSSPTRPASTAASRPSE